MSREQVDAYCIVTGGSSGIGKEVVRGLMARGSHVVIAARNQDTCEKVRAELAGDGADSAPAGKGSCSCARLDLEDFGSVRKFAADQRAALEASGRKLSILVNGAGVMNVGPLPSGEDRHMRSNHYGHFLLTNLLLPAMDRGSRIVNVSSRGHYAGSLSFDADGNIDKHPTHWFRQYGRSKLCNVSFTYELQRRLKPRGIVACSTSPGPVDTPLFWRAIPWWARWLATPLAPLYLRTPEHGARSTLFAALSPQAGEKPYLFIHDDKDTEPNVQGKDPAIARKLWDASVRFVELGKHPGDYVLPPSAD